MSTCSDFVRVCVEFMFVFGFFSGLSLCLCSGLYVLILQVILQNGS